jgi:hypothetical protein
MMQLKKLTFFDTAQMSKTVITDEGYLRTDSVISCSGVYPYKLADGRRAMIYRPANELFSQSTMASMKMLPITNDHPSTSTRLLDSKTAKNFTIGNLGEQVRNDNNRNLWANLVITDDSSIGEIKAGKRQISAGYTADLIDESGAFEGVNYDFVQKNIRGNHVAIVKEGRVGAIASIALDGADAVLINNENYIGEQIMSQNLKTVMLDSIEYQASPEIIDALDKTKADFIAAQEELKSKQTMIDSKTAECDALAKTNAELLARDVSAEIQAAAKARVSLLGTVRAVFGDEAAQKAEAFNDSDIKREVLSSRYKEIDLKAKSVDYVDALFDAEVANHGKNKMALQRKTAAFGDKKEDDGSINVAKVLEDFNNRFGGKK